MGSSQEIVPIGDDAAVMTLYDNTSMNGSNKLASPIVVKPGDQKGPTAEVPKRAFYMYAPQFHWTVSIEVEDQPARALWRRWPMSSSSLGHK